MNLNIFWSTFINTTVNMLGLLRTVLTILSVIWYKRRQTLLCGRNQGMTFPEFMMVVVRRLLSFLMPKQNKLYGSAVTICDVIA